MVTFQKYQQQFAQDIISVINPSQTKAESQSTLDSTCNSQLEALINGFPFYGEPDWDTAHRGAISNLLEVNLPNNAIVPHPDDSGFGYFSSYSYNGSFSGYRDAFFHSIGQMAAASQVASLVQGVNGNLNGSWWSNYAVAILTDAIRQKISISLDSSKLASDLSSYNSNLLPALSASYLAVFQTGYSPTATTLNAIISVGQGAAVYSRLNTAIAAGQFTANINQAIAMGGDSTNAATWFLFNLWIALKALGCPNVDDAIKGFQSAGLTVPGEVGSGSWWNGGYTSWYIPLSGSDVVSVASGTISADLPEQVTTAYASDPPIFPVTSNTSEPNGYSLSLSNWGSLNWYNPPSGSCFGQGTGVLMADGSVKLIERIELGDEVRSNLGISKVVLIESPKRATRTLYQVNSLHVFATSAHPFRAAKGYGPMRLAVDPWALIDGIPTMTSKGVGTLREGVVLVGQGLTETTEITVDQLVAHEARGEEDEYVYDLLLENRGKGYPTYFVGGPETFLAVDAETADFLYDIPATLAIVTAMEVALPCCRKNLRDPATELPSLLTGLKLDDLTGMASKTARSFMGGKLTRPEIPSPNFYMQDGAWDAHASILEFHLVRQFGRLLRREAAMGWRERASAPSPCDRFTVCVHDLELIGEAPVPPNTPMEIQLNLRGWNGSDDIVQKIALDANAKSRWHLILDKVIDFGLIHTKVKPAALSGTIKTGDKTFGRFRAAITEEMLQGLRADHFVFSLGGQIVGRISLEQRRVAEKDLVRESSFSEQWTNRHAMSMAISLGRQIGSKLIALIQK